MRLPKLSSGTNRGHGFRTRYHLNEEAKLDFHKNLANY